MAFAGGLALMLAAVYGLTALLDTFLPLGVAVWLAPLIVDGIAKTIRELKREGLSVLLCEQNLRFARLVADRACIIEKGRLCYNGPMAGLDADAALRERYLSV